ncbi:SIP domain-containing protein [Methylocapsa palsarum]|uniref:SIP domain-containing protein n=1 Tax=Methylocapsa palsarum TaxID=1612308 RepID=UPI003CC79F10
MIGDATALPAIAGIVERLSTQARAQVFVEVADPAEDPFFDFSRRLYGDSGSQIHRCLQRT